MTRTAPPPGPKIDVEVTAEMITQAVPRDSSHCMIADAVRAAFPQARRISVDVQTIRFTLPGKGARYTYLTPRKVQKALLDFDQGTEPEPLRFQLRGGQASWMQSRRKPKPSQQDRTPAQQEVTKRMSLVFRGGTGNIPEISGGSPPPVGPLAGGDVRGKVPKARRRSFGLRAMDR